jgi:hypothetical protein
MTKACSLQHFEWHFGWFIGVFIIKNKKAIPHLQGIAFSRRDGIFYLDRVKHLELLKRSC